MRAYWLLALLLLALLLPMRAQAALVCSLSGSTVDFGTINTQPIPQTSLSPNNITVTCSGGTVGNTVRICAGIDAGNGTGSTIADRIMNSGANPVHYEIYFNPAFSTVWGDSSNAGQQELDVTLGAGGAVTQSFTTYDRITNPPAQSEPSGLYTSTLNLTGKIPSGASPCANNTGTAITGGSMQYKVTLNSTCSISASTIDFGNLTSLTPVNNLSGNLSATCTNGAAYTIAMNAGSTPGNTIAARKMNLNGAGAGVVNYQLYRDTGPTNVWGDGTAGNVTYSGSGNGSAQTIPVYAQLPSQATPTPGLYKDTVTVTIAF